MQDHRIVSTPDAPAAIGPYSQAVVTGDLVFCSGQIALDPATAKVVEGDARVQTQQVLTNLKHVLAAAGSGLELAVKTTVFLKDMNDYAAVNEVYATFFPGKKPPARAAVEVARLPRDVRVEIDCIALIRR